jgi:hypothetical protein
MTVREGDEKRKAIFQILAHRINKDRGYWEYKLRDQRGYTDGRYYRERDLKLERRAK